MFGLVPVSLFADGDNNSFLNAFGRNHFYERFLFLQKINKGRNFFLVSELRLAQYVRRSFEMYLFGRGGMQKSLRVVQKKLDEPSIPNGNILKPFSKSGPNFSQGTAGKPFVQSPAGFLQCNRVNFYVHFEENRTGQP